MTQNVLKQELSMLSQILTKLHKELVDIQFKKYEKDQGRISNNGQKLNLLLTHQDFQWLRPLSALIVTLDDSVAEDAVDSSDVKMYLKDIELLLFSKQNKDFSSTYQPYEADTPNIILLHQELKRSLQEISKLHLDS